MNSLNKSATGTVADFLFLTIFSSASYPELALYLTFLVVFIVYFH